MKNSEITEKTSAFLRTFLEKEGYLLLKTEYVQEEGLFYLRAYIDLTDEERAARAAAKEAAKREEEIAEDAEVQEAENSAGTDGQQEEAEEPVLPEVTINDCAAVSRRLSKWLDKEDLIEDEYTLEVCSRGYLKEEGENS